MVGPPALGKSRLARAAARPQGFAVTEAQMAAWEAPQEPPSARELVDLPGLPSPTPRAS